MTRKVINLARECGNKIELSSVDTGGLPVRALHCSMDRCCVVPFQRSNQQVLSAAADCVSRCTAPPPAARPLPATRAAACRAARCRGRASHAALPCALAAAAHHPAESLVPEPLRKAQSPQEFMDSLHEVRFGCCAALRWAVLGCAGSFSCAVRSVLCCAAL